MALRSSSMSRRSADLDAVIKALGEYRKRKGWLNFHCPFHHGGGFNFGVSIPHGNYSCFACGETGSLRDLTRHLGLQPVTEVTHPQRGLTPDPTSQPVTAGLSKCLRANREAYASPVVPAGVVSDFWSDFEVLSAAGGSMMAARAREYLTWRGVDVCKTATGVSAKAPYYVVFPFLDAHGKLVYWQGRAIDQRRPKTINPREDEGWPGKANVLWNVNNIKKGSHVVLCEGIFDALACQRVLGRYATCLLGSTISREQVMLLKARQVSSVLVFMDGDANEKALDVAETLYHAGVNTYIVHWPDGYELSDPGNIQASELKFLASCAVQITPLACLGLRL